MKRLALLLAVLATPALAQSPTADSLKAMLGGLSGRDRLPVLMSLVNNIETRAPQQALSFAAEGLALAEQAGDREAQAAFLSTTAFCYSLTGDLELALRYGERTLELSTQIGNRDRMAKAHATLGATFTYMGRYSRALEHNLDALRIREELHLENASLQSMNSIGVLYHHAGQYDTAIDYYRRMLARLANRPDTARMVINAKLNIGFSEYKQGKFQEALADSRGNLELARRANNGTLAYALFVAGIAASDLGQHADAAKYLRQSLAEYEREDQKHGRVQVLNALGRLSLLTGALPRALPYLKESARLSQQIRARDELKASYELLAALHERQGNVSEAYRYYRLFVATKDSIYNTQESERLADASMKLVTLKKDNEIESLKKEKVISALELEKQHYYTAILGVVLASLAAIIAILVRYSGKLKNGSVLLEAKNAQLAQLNVELNAQLQEVRTLSGLLPICAWCKKVRDDQGYWQQLEGYIAQRTEAQFSHGICPECAPRLEHGSGGRAP